MLFAYFGLELSNHVSAAEVHAQQWYERHAPKGSARMQLGPSSATRLTARYPEVSLADAPALLEQPEFVGRRLGRRDLPRIARAIRTNSDRRTYLIVTRHQYESARLNGVLPPGSLGSLVRAHASSPRFGLVYQRPGAWIFVMRRHGS
jgi:hypothetical protein